MKKILVLFLFIFLSLPVFAADKNDIYKINIKNKTFYCMSNCYDLTTLKKDKALNSYKVEMLYDLIDSNHQEFYKSPYGNDYITHLIFESELKENDFYTRPVGFVTGKIKLDEDGGGAHYIYSGLHYGIPKNISIKYFSKLYKSWAQNSFLDEVKILADI